MKLKFAIIVVAVFMMLSSCEVRYSMTGGQFSGAKTFSVDLFKSQTALASPIYAQQLTEAYKSLLLSQSPLKLAENDGELQYEGFITEYRVTPVAIQGNETASLNRLTITVKLKYINTLEPELSFDKSFSKFADFDATSDLLAVQASLWETINDQLMQEFYNASVGNW